MPVDENGCDLVAVLAITADSYEARSVYTRFKYARRIVLITNKLDGLPSDLIASADIVSEIAPPTPEHYRAGAREAKVAGMTEEIAEFLAPLPFDTVATAFRVSRPLAASVRHLLRAQQEAAKAGPAPAKPSGPRLEDMAGYGAARDWGIQLSEDLRAWKAGEIGWEDVDRGALLYGPPGCGKTSYAKALANTCGVELVLASAAKWQAKGHLGDYLRAMRGAFDEARKKAPCLLFIDEADSFGSRDAPTSDDHHRDYRRQVINGLLECLDPSEGRDGVVVVAATNNPSVIDPALLRSGRLEKLIGIPLPDGDARAAILLHHMRGQKIDVNLKRFVWATRGWSGADLEKLARDARRIARRRKVAVTEDLLMEVMPARHVFNAAELRATAVHEAGHAIIGVLLACDTLTSVHIERDVPLHGSRLVVGLAEFEPDERAAKTAVYYDTRIAMLLGGLAAETLVYGCGSDSAGGDPSSDLAIASDIATRLERHFGLGESLSVELGRGERPLEYLRDRDPELRRLVDARLKLQFARAIEILSDHRAELDHLVEMLVTKFRVEGDEVRALLSSPRRKTASVRT
ncbi:AAA family ATPase [Shinella sp. S4-D37]|uniref:AAA family ATPase n=1 Tax=Shinella sp. S4-D37 TaxID=3161999 RepID=UPI0034659914